MGTFGSVRSSTLATATPALLVGLVSQRIPFLIRQSDVPQKVSQILYGITVLLLKLKRPLANFFLAGPNSLYGRKGGLDCYVVLTFVCCAHFIHQARIVHQPLFFQQRRRA